MEKVAPAPIVTVNCIQEAKKRGNVLKAIEWFVHFGADPDILVDAHPHIGTNKLPKIITAMREAIIAAGGEVHFNAKMTDITLKDNTITGLQINDTNTYTFSDVILATGHSARDIFYLLHKKNIAIEAKPFAIGVRVRAPARINRYHTIPRRWRESLFAASLLCLGGAGRRLGSVLFLYVSWRYYCALCY